MVVQLLRWVAYLLLTLLLLCVAVVLCLRFFPARFVPLVQSVVKDASGYELRISDLSLQYAPLVLNLKGVTVVDPALSDQPMVELADGKITVDLWRAIRGKHPYWSLHAGEGSVLLLPSEQSASPAAEAATAVDILAFLSFFGVSASDIKLLEVKDGKTITTRIDADFARLDDNRIDATFSVKSPNQEIAFKGVLEHARETERTRLKLSAERLDLSSLLAEAADDADEETPAENTEPSEQQPSRSGKTTADVEKTHVAEQPISWAWLIQLGLLDLDVAIGEVVLGEDRVSDLHVSLAFDPEQLRVKRLSGRIATEIDSHPIDRKFAVSGRLKPLSMLTSGPDATVKLGIDSDDMELAIEGSTNLNGAQGNDLTLNLQVEDLQKFQPLLPVSSEEISPLKLQAVVTTAENSYAVDDFRLRYGESDLGGDIEVNSTSEVLKIEGALQSKLLHIPKPVGGEAEEEAQASDDDNANATAKTDDAKLEAKGKEPEFLISKQPVDWSWLDITDIDVSIKADKLQIFDAKFTTFEVQAESEQGSFAIKPFAAKFGGGGFSGALNLDKIKEGAALSLVFDMNGVDLDAFGLTSKEQLEGGVTDVDIELKGEGVSPHDLAASLNGKVLLTVKEAIVKNDTFELIGSDLVMETLNKLNPFAKSDPTTELECALVKFDVADGVLNSPKQLVVETTKMEIIGDGKIDLNDESLSIGISPSTKGGIGVNVGSLVKFMKLGGTLANPAPTADAAGLLKSGAAIGAAASTGGLSIVAEGLIKQAVNAGSACERALQPPVPAAATDTKK